MKIWCLIVLSMGSLWGQMTKLELFELVDKQVDPAVIISLVTRQCVAFELDGEAVVELAGKLPADILKAVVDCDQSIAAVLSAPEVVKPEAPMKMEPSPEATKEKERPSLEAFKSHEYFSVSMESNKSSFKALEIEIRILPNERLEKPAIYTFKGETEEEQTVRCYRINGPKFMEPGNYEAYIYLVSDRNKGLFARSQLRTSIHKLHIEIQGSGPVTFIYHSHEERTFSSKSELNIETEGPLVIHSEEKASFDGLKGFDEVVRLFTNGE